MRGGKKVIIEPHRHEGMSHVVTWNDVSQHILCVQVYLLPEVKKMPW